MGAEPGTLIAIRLVNALSFGLDVRGHAEGQHPRANLPMALHQLAKPVHGVEPEVGSCRELLLHQLEVLQLKIIEEACHGEPRQAELGLLAPEEIQDDVLVIRCSLWMEVDEEACERGREGTPLGKSHGLLVVGVNEELLECSWIQANKRGCTHQGELQGLGATRIEIAKQLRINSEALIPEALDSGAQQPEVILVRAKVISTREQQYTVAIQSIRRWSVQGLLLASICAASSSSGFSSAT